MAELQEGVLGFVVVLSWWWWVLFLSLMFLVWYFFVVVVGVLGWFWGVFCLVGIFFFQRNTVFFLSGFSFLEAYV